MQIVNGVPVWGTPQLNAVDQMRAVLDHGAAQVALMADHHLGYSQPIGGVAGYVDHISPSGVGYDIGCGNKAVLLDVDPDRLKDIESIMDEVQQHVIFGVGQNNPAQPDHDLFDDPAWSIPCIGHLKQKARNQLGTCGSGNHYVDLFKDDLSRVWCGVHFGSRGLGHSIASHYIKAAGGKDSVHAVPTLLHTDSELGQEYIEGMRLAGRYAYAGRDWVCQRVAEIVGGPIIDEVHNHHNFAWEERHNGQDMWVVRKGATPAFPGQRGFVGATMAEPSVILEGKESVHGAAAMYSTVHGAGRMMSRTQAAGRFKRRRIRGTREYESIQVRAGEIPPEEMQQNVVEAGVTLRGGGTDEAPRAYKRLSEVLAAHADSVDVLLTLTPVGVLMA